MKDFSITFENKTQKTRIQLNCELRIIEEETLYMQENGKISKCSLQRDIYNDDTTLECMRIFFNAQINALTEFYRAKGKFEIKL